MENEFIPYEQALALKELGFDEPCFGYYNTNTQGRMAHKVIEGLLEWFGDDYQPHNSELHHSKITAPLYQQAFRWFREKYNLHILINVKDGIWYFERFSINGFNTYEEAESACLDKLIETVKNK